MHFLLERDFPHIMWENKQTLFLFVLMNRNKVRPSQWAGSSPTHPKQFSKAKSSAGIGLGRWLDDSFQKLVIMYRRNFKDGDVCISASSSSNRNSMEEAYLLFFAVHRGTSALFNLHSIILWLSSLAAEIYFLQIWILELKKSKHSSYFSNTILVTLCWLLSCKGGNR